MKVNRILLVFAIVLAASTLIYPFQSTAKIDEEEKIVEVDVEETKTVEKIEEVRPETRCRIHFELKGWSVFYRRAKGEGRISCDNGQTAKVRLSAHGGGITFGKQEIKNGHGSFSLVENINKLFGSYAASEAHAGAKKSADAQALTKGSVSLAFSGTGKGYDLGFSFGRLKIIPVEEKLAHETKDVMK